MHRQIPPTPQKMDFNHLNIQGKLGTSETDGTFAEDAVDPVHYRKLTRTIPLSVSTKCTGWRSYIKGMGSLIFKGEDDKTIIINGVFYSPDAACTLISPAALIRAGASISTEDNDILICNGSKLPVLRVHLCQSKPKWEMPPYLPKIMGFTNSNICGSTDISYKVSTENLTSDKLTLFESKLDSNNPMMGNVRTPDEHNLDNLLHSVFGHIGNKHLKQLACKHFGDKASKGITQKSETCQHCCIANRMQRLVLASCDGIVEPMDIVTADLMGNFNNAIPYGGKYELTIWDIGSTYKDWCHLQGEGHGKSLPYHDGQNGSIEQYNREIADMGRMLLHKSGLPREFWGFAFMWASHIQNLIPNSLTKDTAPVELIFHNKPCYNQMRLFGELAYIHIPHEKRRKLDDREIEGHIVMFLGNSKGWLFYLPSSKSLRTSAWAEFPKSSKACRVIQQWSLPWKPK
ncbi:hypothetical protein O181_028085 [Austropuccinia psidii MF-1]|uniref:Retroviral polymerase SH3-like domain-containing protein n=1 Tax=Austropuccinia psidii MF-1 TaxID=1389203 RepID=A0A9Q3CS35_9BASI|nr:hypothetical protein [Austropuccinia psidii MF-1]